MKVLITGSSGFVGAHLVRFLSEARPDVELFGLARRPCSGARCFTADIMDPAAVDAVFDAVTPDRIVHLAAQSSPHLSWQDPRHTLAINVEGLLNVLEAVRRRQLPARVLVVGSGEEYGPARSQGPVGEDEPLRPLSPYAVSKIAQGYLGLQYHLSHKLDVLRTRTFNHTGPGRGASFAESSFAKQIAEIEAGQRPPVIEVGNLEAMRDFTDVRDVVRAYWELLEHGKAGEVYNVCSGRGVRIGEILKRLLALADVNIDVREDPERLRPADIPSLVGSPARLQAATGWRPERALEQSLRDLLDAWRAQVRTSTPVAGH